MLMLRWAQSTPVALVRSCMGLYATAHLSSWSAFSGCCFAIAAARMTKLLPMAKLDASTPLYLLRAKARAITRPMMTSTTAEATTGRDRLLGLSISQLLGEPAAGRKRVRAKERAEPECDSDLPTPKYAEFNPDQQCLNMLVQLTGGAQSAIRVDGMAHIPADKMPGLAARVRRDLSLPKRTYKTFYNRKDDKLPGFVERGRFLLVPAFWLIDRLAPKYWTSTLCRGLPAPSLARFSGPDPWPTQRQALEAVKGHLSWDCAKHASIMVDAEPGAGKTRLGAMVISWAARRTLWLVHNTDILNQTRRALQEYMPDARIGSWTGRSKKSEGCDLVMGTFQSMPPIDEGYGLVVVDEAHHLTAATFFRVLADIRSPKLLLSGTPTRKDGLDNLLWWTSGYRLVMRPQFPLQAPVFVHAYLGHTRPVFNTAALTPSLDWHAIRASLNTDGARNRFLLGLLRDMRAKGRKVLVASFNVSHVKLLAKELDAPVLVGGMTEAQTTLAKQAPIIVGTFGFVREGLSIPIDTLVAAQPPLGNLKQFYSRLRASLRSDLQVHVIRDWYRETVMSDPAPLYNSDVENRFFRKEMGWTIHSRRRHIDYDGTQEEAHFDLE